MTIELKKGMTPEDVRALLKQTAAPKKTLRRHVGQLKRGLDGLTYQNEVRREWD